MFRNAFINVCLPRAFQFECFLPACSLHLLEAIKEKKDQIGSVYCRITMKLYVFVIQRRWKLMKDWDNTEGKGGDMAEGSQFTKSTDFVYTP